MTTRRATAEAEGRRPSFLGADSAAATGWSVLRRKAWTWGAPVPAHRGVSVHQMRRPSAQQPAYTQAASPCSMLRSPGQVKGDEKTGRGVYALQRRECSWGPQEEPETRSSPPTSSAAELSGIARFLNSKTAPAGGRVVGHAVASKGILLGFQNLKMRKAPPSKGGAAQAARQAPQVLPTKTELARPPQGTRSQRHPAFNTPALTFSILLLPSIDPILELHFPKLKSKIV